MSKLVLDYVENDEVTGHIVMCPACGNGHKFDTKQWRFNGNYESPTFSPSMLVRVQDGWVKRPQDQWVWSPRSESGWVRVPRALLPADFHPNEREVSIEELAQALGVEPNPEAIRAIVRPWLDKLPWSVCHSFVENGQIRYLSDCTHNLRDQTVPLGEV